MNSIPDDELLSAYLDGELSEEERARVEQLLAEQPEARQMLDELRALSGGFEALPRHRLEADFASRVLRAAEREMLAGDPPGETPVAPPQSVASFSNAVAASSAREHSIRPAERQPFAIDWKRWRRPLAWAGAAMAAGLLLMVMERGRPNVAPIGQVAHAPNAGVEFKAAPGAAPAAEPLAARDGDSRLGRVERFDKSSPETAPAEEAAGVPSSAGNLGGGASSARMARRSKLGDETPAAPMAAPAPRSLAAPAKPGENGRSAAMPDEPQPENKQKPEVQLGLRGLAEAEGADLYWFGVERQEGDKIVSEPLDPKTLIVWCDVEENVADKPEFRQMLLSNGIAWEPSVPLLEADKKEAADKPAAGTVDSAKDVSEKLGEKVESADALARKQKAGAAGGRANMQRRFAGQTADLSSLESEVLRRERSLDRLQAVAESLNENAADYVLLEASDEQLKAVLTEFDQHPELFLTVNVEPAPEAPSQQAFYAYNRGRAPVDRKQAQFDIKTPSLQAAIVEEQRLGKQVARAGRAQQVLVLSQQVRANGESPPAKNDADAEERDAAKRAEDSSKKTEQSPAAGVEAKAPIKSAAAGQKAASPAGGSKPPAGPSEGLAAEGFQQALIILRRVPPAAAAPEAKEDEPKPPDAAKDGKQSD